MKAHEAGPNLRAIAVERFSAVLQWLPVLVGVGVSAATLFLWQALIAQDRAQTQQTIELAAASVKNEIDERMSSRILALVRMAKHWQYSGKPRQDEWEFEAGLNIQNFEGYQAIVWVDPSLRARWLVPLKGNEEAKNLYLGFEKKRQEALVAARNRKEVTVTPVVQLVQGGRGFLVFVPIFRGQNFEGFIVGVFRTQELLDAIMEDLEEEDEAILKYSVSVFEGEEEVYDRHENEQDHEHQVAKDWGHEVKTDLYGTTWRVLVWPEPELLREARSLLPEAVLIGGLSTAFLLTWAVYLAQRARQRARETETTNQELDHEIREYKRTEEALRESQQMLKLVTDNIPQFIFWKDRNSVYLGCNRNFAQSAGVDNPENIVGKTDYNLPWKREEANFFRECDRRIMETDTPGYHIIEPLLQANGEQAWLDTNKIPLHDSEGNVVGILGTFEDITERKRVEEALEEAHAELESRVENRTADLAKANSNLRMEVTERKQVLEALQESEERLKAILDNSTALVYLKDTQGRYLLINRRYETLFHLNGEEIKGKTDYDLFPKEMAEVYRVNDQKVLEAGTALECEEAVHQDDGLLTYLSIKFPLYDADQVPYAVCGISSDITERKRAEEALQSSVATNRALLDAMPDLMVRLSKDGTFVNYKLPKHMSLPVPASEFLGKTLYEVLPVEVAQPAIDCIERALQTGKLQLFEFQLLANSNLRDYEARVVVSAETEVMAIVRDITERKRAEADTRNALEKEQELGELKSRFVSMTSHEFRTPLTTILSSAELLEIYSHKWGQEKKLTHLQRIQVAVKQMTGLLNDVLLIGKAEAGKLELKPTHLNLAQFCGDLVEEIQLSAAHPTNGCPAHGIAFVSQGQCTHVYLDEKLLRHILSNLLSNAVKYSPQGGTVHFDLICNPEEVTLQVRDEGIGIPLADQAQLFNSFHRASNVGVIAGTGLGLAIVKKSVEVHGGTIALKSEVGVGTTFTVSLPANKQI